MIVVLGVLAALAFTAAFTALVGWRAGWFRPTPRAAQAAPPARWVNDGDGFRLANPVVLRVAGRAVLMIDDVWTTARWDLPYGALNPDVLPGHEFITIEEAARESNPVAASITVVANHAGSGFVRAWVGTRRYDFPVEVR